MHALPAALLRVVVFEGFKGVWLNKVVIGLKWVYEKVGEGGGGKIGVIWTFQR